METKGSQEAKETLNELKKIQMVLPLLTVLFYFIHRYTTVNMKISVFSFQMRHFGQQIILNTNNEQIQWKPINETKIFILRDGPDLRPC